MALETDVQLVLNQLRGDGRDVVRNGYLPERLVTTVVGDVAVEVPRIRSRDGEVVNFASSMIPRYLRRSQSISAWAAYACCLKGSAERHVASVLEVVLDEGEKNLAPSALSELTKSWSHLIRGSPPGAALRTGLSPIVPRGSVLHTRREGTDIG